MRLKTGEKILSVLINEYNSIEELQKDFLNMPKEMSLTGKKLYSSKKKAMNGLEYQKKHFFGQMARQFYYTKVLFEGTEYFLLYELLID